ncbi:MAG TPA: PIN domain-containing protein [Isosphaeraceae bacterium]
MIRAVADTHALIWYALANPQLSSAARAAIDGAAAVGDQVAISAMSLIEIIYLLEKNKINPTTLDRVLALLDLNELLVIAAVDRPVALAMRSISRAQISDLPVRVIAATAVRLGVPLISRDGKIQASGVTTIW